MESSSGSGNDHLPTDVDSSISSPLKSEQIPEMINSVDSEQNEVPPDSKEECLNTDKEEEDEWIDILGSGQLLKKVLKQGINDTRPQRLDICTVKYVGKYNNEVVDEGEVTVNVGDAEVIQGLDLAIPLMDLEEEAELVVGPRFAFGSEGRKPDIPPGATLNYTVTLLKAEPEALVHSMPLKERKAVGNRKKDRGNYWYSRNDHTLAIQCYRRALEYLDDIGLSSREEDKSVTEEEIHSLLEDRMKTYNNLAQAQLKIKAFDPALQSVDNVLRCQPNNVKALYRKGKIMAEKGETEEGISLLKKALALDPENAEAKSILNQLRTKKKIDIAQEKNLYKKMLGANKPAENREASPHREFMRWGMVAGCVGAVFSVLVAYKWYKPF